MGGIKRCAQRCALARCSIRIAPWRAQKSRKGLLALSRRGARVMIGPELSGLWSTDQVSHGSWGLPATRPWRCSIGPRSSGVAGVEHSRKRSRSHAGWRARPQLIEAAPSAVTSWISRKCLLHSPGSSLKKALLRCTQGAPPRSGSSAPGAQDSFGRHFAHRPLCLTRPRLIRRAARVSFPSIYQTASHPNKRKAQKLIECSEPCRLGEIDPWANRDHCFRPAHQ